MTRYDRLHTARVLLHLVRLSLWRILLHPRRALVEAALMLFNNAMMFANWVLIFQLVDTLRGWHLSDVAILYGTGATAFGLATGIFGGVRNLAFEIESGRFDNCLCRPVPPLALGLSGSTSLHAWGDAMTGPVLWILVAGVSAGEFGFLLLAAVLGAVLIGSFGILIQSLAFWLSGTALQSDTLLFILISFVVMPMHNMPVLFKLFLFTLVPAGFVAFLPVELLQHFSGEKFAAVALAPFAFLLIAVGVFQLGLRRYTGASTLRTAL